MIAIVLNTVPSYLKFKKFVIFKCLLKNEKIRFLLKNAIFIYLQASPLASWNLACYVWTASDLSDGQIASG
jgi:hypothetical protein